MSLHCRLAFCETVEPESQQLRWIAGLRELQKLKLRGWAHCGILEHISRLPALRALDLGKKCNMTEAIRRRSHPGLCESPDVQVEEPGELVPLERLPPLQWLRVPVEWESLYQLPPRLRVPILKGAS